MNDQGPRRIGGFKLPPPQDLREVVSRAFEAVRGQGLDQLEWLGASRSGGAWRLPVLNDAFEVDLSASRVRTRAGAEVGILWKSLSLHYLAVRDRPEPRPPELVLADLPEGRTYAEVYRRRVVERLCSTAGRDAATLLAAGTALGGRPADAGDLAFDFSVFPRVQLRLIWHAADEEFPPSATVLLPANVGSFFCVEDIVIVSEQLVARLAGRTF